MFKKKRGGIVSKSFLHLWKKILILSGINFERKNLFDQVKKFRKKFKGFASLQQ